MPVQCPSGQTASECFSWSAPCVCTGCKGGYILQGTSCARASLCARPWQAWLDCMAAAWLLPMPMLPALALKLHYH